MNDDPYLALDGPEAREQGGPKRANEAGPERRE